MEEEVTMGPRRIIVTHFDLAKIPFGLEVIKLDSNPQYYIRLVTL